MRAGLLCSAAGPLAVQRGLERPRRPLVGELAAAQRGHAKARGGEPDHDHIASNHVDPFLKEPVADPCGSGFSGKIGREASQLWPVCLVWPYQEPESVILS